MELFIEVTGPRGVGKTRLLQIIKEVLEKEYYLNWRHQGELGEKEQVLSEIVLKRKD